MLRLLCAAALQVVPVSAASAVDPVLNIINLQTEGAFGIANNAVFQQTAPHPTGTGRINSFLRIQSNRDIEEGYNTDFRPVEFDEKTDQNFTRALRLSEVPVVNILGVPYRQFMLDINESATRPLLSLNSLKIFLGPTGNLTGFPNLGTLVYDLDANVNTDVLLDYNVNGGGSGTGDMFLYVPDTNFSVSANPFVYLYSRFGEPLGGLPTAPDAGFEEWAAGVAQPGSSIPGPFPGPLPNIPEPTAAGAIALMALCLWRRRS